MLQRCLFTFVILILQFLAVHFAKINNTYGQTPTRQQFTVRVAKLSGLDDKQTAVMRQAINLFQVVMNDAQFRRDLAALERVKNDAVIKPSERLKKYKVASGDVNNSLTTQQIVTNLLNGTEYFDPRGSDGQIIIDNEADISWRIIKRARCVTQAGRRICNVRGSTPNRPGRNGRIREGDYYINTRSWFVDQVVAGDQDILNLVEHLAHEWSHKFGFIDTGLEEKKGKFQLFSYVFGRLVEASAKRIALNCLATDATSRS